jgi:hypothetical protein
LRLIREEPSVTKEVIITVLRHTTFPCLRRNSLPKAPKGLQAGRSKLVERLGAMMTLQANLIAPLDDTAGEKNRRSRETRPLI